MEYHTAIVIGRFQPFHNYHFLLVRKALELGENCIVGLGSANVAPDTRNPFSPMEREKMIRSCFPKDQDRIFFAPLSNSLYNDEQWIATVQTSIGNFTRQISNEKIILVGTDKDHSTDYLHWFPQWHTYANSTVGDFSASDVRQSYFLKTDDWRSLVPPTVASFLEKFKSTKEYERLCDEYNFILSYRKAWEKAPYPPTFLTADALVKCSGHILVNERMGMPGKGLWCLPGGFVGQGETIRQAAVRELKEETGIKIPPATLDRSIVTDRVFDHPDRSLRGRTVTHAYLFDLGDGNLPAIRPQEGEVVRTWWMPYKDVLRYERRWFEDHRDIIQYFLGI